VLGGVLSSVFIPVLVEELRTRVRAEAWRSVSALVTSALAVLVAMTVGDRAARAADHRRVQRPRAGPGGARTARAGDLLPAAVRAPDRALRVRGHR